MSSANQLRNLPAVDKVFQDSRLQHAAASVSALQLTSWIRDSVQECRQAMLAGSELSPIEATDFVVAKTLQRQSAENGAIQQPVINATGILLHTNLGRAPLAERAIQRIQNACGYSNVEMNLHSGKRSKRGERACNLLRQLSGAENAAIVNNCAAATMLALQTIAKGREVVISRGQLVEIGGGYRLPEVFSASGAIMKEVGTTNRTYLRDYENAISEKTAAIIHVHRSNFCQSGFVTEPKIEDLVTLGKAHGIPVIDDIGSGCMSDLSAVGLEEPLVPNSIKAGADVTLFSGDKLYGGPQAGLIVGRSEWVEKLRKSPMMRALRVDKMTLVAIEATADIHLSGDAKSELPLLKMMHTSEDDVHKLCQHVQGRLSVPSGVIVEVIACVSEIGGGSVPGSEIPSAALRISGIDCESLAAALRSGDPAVLGVIREDAVQLDLRTVQSSEIDALVECMSAALLKTTGA